jgi:hypothetical protein
MPPLRCQYQAVVMNRLERMRRMMVGISALWHADAGKARA